MPASEPLFIIPARGQSKGIPGKNIKSLGGKPLIYYTIEAAREAGRDEHICVSSDDPDIIESVRLCGLDVPFVRPTHLSTDQAGTEGVLLHALDHYRKQGIHYEVVVLLQPTSPLRNGSHITEALKLYRKEYDMVVSVRKAYGMAALCQETHDSFLFPVIPGNKRRRQDFEKYYELNGAIYIINVNSLKKGPISGFTRVKKYLMDKKYSLDIDDHFDWLLAEYLIQTRSE